MDKKYPVGTRVLLCGKHPYSGRSGEVIGYETIKIMPELGACMKVKLDDGQESFVMEERHVRPVRTHTMHTGN